LIRSQNTKDRACSPAENPFSILSHVFSLSKVELQIGQDRKDENEMFHRTS
jgi:hypothetical protein